jgi:ankyrin repeat protein
MAWIQFNRASIMQLARSNNSRASKGFVLLAVIAMVAFACHGGKGTAMAINPERMFGDPNLLAAARAIESGNLPTLDKLLRHGTPVNGRGNDGATLLMFGMGTKRIEAVIELLKRGADPNQLSDKGLSAVMLAAGSDDPDLLPILLDHGANPNLHNDRDEPVTFTAADQKRWRNLELLLDRGADINATDRAGYTLMVFLAFGDQYEPIVKLLERGADFRKVGYAGWTLANAVQESRLKPDSPDGRWLQKAKAFLEAHGVKFPVPPPQRP